MALEKQTHTFLGQFSMKTTQVYPLFLSRFSFLIFIQIFIFIGSHRLWTTVIHIRWAVSERNKTLITRSGLQPIQVIVHSITANRKIIMVLILLLQIDNSLPFMILQVLRHLDVGQCFATYFAFKWNIINVFQLFGFDVGCWDQINNSFKSLK